MLIQNVGLLLRERFDMDLAPPDQQVVIPRRPSGPPLTTTHAYVCAYSPFRSPPS